MLLTKPLHKIIVIIPALEKKCIIVIIYGVYSELVTITPNSTDHVTLHNYKINIVYREYLYV